MLRYITNSDSGIKLDVPIGVAAYHGRRLSKLIRGNYSKPIQKVEVVIRGGFRTTNKGNK